MSQDKLTVGILAYHRESKVLVAVEQIKAWSQQHAHVKVLWSDHMPAEWLGGLDVVSDARLRSAHVLISIGGDGTFLSAARLVAGLQTPILGLHTGTTGFLTDFPVESLMSELETIAAGTFDVRPRLMMDIERRMGDQCESDIVLNEILIRPRGDHRMVNLRVEVNGKFLTDYWADFLLVSTPTGSTAYNLSAGGPILYPTAEAFVITAVNPPSLSVRPLVVPSTATLRVTENDGQDCLLLLDGRIEQSLRHGEELTLRRSPWSTHLIHSSQYGFVDALKDKLGWCGNFRNTRGTDGC